MSNFYSSQTNILLLRNQCSVTTLKIYMKIWKDEWSTSVGYCWSKTTIPGAQMCAIFTVLFLKSLAKYLTHCKCLCPHFFFNYTIFKTQVFL